MEGVIALFIPILVPLGTFALVFGIIYLNKKESLAMIEKGMNPREHQGPRGPEPYRFLKWGLLLLGSGMGLFAAFLLDEFLVHSSKVQILYFALTIIGGGLGLVVSYKMEMKALKEKESQGSSDSSPVHHTGEA